MIYPFSGIIILNPEFHIYHVKLLLDLKTSTSIGVGVNIVYTRFKDLNFDNLHSTGLKENAKEKSKFFYEWEEPHGFI